MRIYSDVSQLTLAHIQEVGVYADWHLMRVSAREGIFYYGVDETGHSTGLHSSLSMLKLGIETRLFSWGKG